MVRGFKLRNGKGQEYSLMDIENRCLLTEPTGLGISYITEYEQLGNTFVTSMRKTEQGKISGVANTLNYDNLRDLANFIEDSEKLALVYTVPYKNGSKEYLKDIELSLLGKTEKDARTGVLSSPIDLNCKSLWYEERSITQSIEPTENEVRWDFKWDSKFTGYDTRSFEYVNEGHVEAPIEVEIDGHVLNPSVALYVDGELIQTVEFNVEIAQYEKLLYGTKENEFYVKKQNTDGTIEDLYEYEDSSVLNFANDNVIRLPKNRSCEIRLNAETEIEKAKITVYNFYKFV
jgi:hypothetical protein